MPGEEDSDSEGQQEATWEHQSLAQVESRLIWMGRHPEQNISTRTFN